ncbi:MAG: hypothetical protein HYW37_00275 [Candidatus Colwellbacteria bacterium]|nr:hypothetical protein [Candidatus Colwellbacteria bacterium]
MFKKLVWTRHAQFKMRFYGLSEARIKRVMNMPLRIESGIAPSTIAMLQRAGSVKHPYEIWVMIAEKKDARRVISAWRYPGRTKPGEALPEEIIREIREAR